MYAHLAGPLRKRRNPEVEEHPDTTPVVLSMLAGAATTVLVKYVADGSTGASVGIGLGVWAAGTLIAVVSGARAQAQAWTDCEDIYRTR